MLAHYFEDKPLRCLILNPDFVEKYDNAADWYPDDFFPIEEVIIEWGKCIIVVF